MKKNTPPSSSSSGEEKSSSSEEDVPIIKPTPSTAKPSAPPTKQVSSEEEDDSSSSEEEDVPKPPPFTSKPTGSTKKQVSSSEEEDSSSSEDEDVSKPPPSTSKPTVSTKKQVSSSEEEDSSSEEEVDDPKIKPLSSTTEKASTSKPKPTVSVPATEPKPTTTKPAGTKRPNEVSSREDTKRVKTDTTAEDTSKKSGGAPCKRKWTKQDVLALLEGMISFQKVKRISVYQDSNAFFGSVKNSFSLHVRNVTKSQFMDKVYNLRKKYTGQGTFTKPHDLKCVELAKSIWVDNGMGTESGKSNRLSRKSERKNKKLESGDDNKGLVSGGGEVDVSECLDESFLVRGIAGFGLDDRAVKQGWRLAPVEGKKRIKEEMKELRAKEFEYLILKSDILKEAALMIAQVLKHQDI